MDEVSSLPKLTNDQHSSTAGHLANYHSSISEQLMRAIGHLQKDVKSISDKTTQILTEKMNDYKKQYDQADTESREIIESMTSKSFEELREQLNSIGENLLNNFNLLKKRRNSDLVIMMNKQKKHILFLLSLKEELLFELIAYKFYIYILF